MDGSYCHVDPVRGAAGDYFGGFLLRDEVMWEECRWDVSAYPACTGELSWYFLAVQDGLIEPLPEEEETAAGEEAEVEAETAEPTEEEPQEGVLELETEEDPVI